MPPEFFDPTPEEQVIASSDARQCAMLRASSNPANKVIQKALSGRSVLGCDCVHCVQPLNIKRQSVKDVQIRSILMNVFSASRDTVRIFKLNDDQLSP
jgi:hypothetical protein